MAEEGGGESKGDGGDATSVRNADGFLVLRRSTAAAGGAAAGGDAPIEGGGETFEVDIRDAPANAEARARQEAKWANTSVDVRQQLHAREAAKAHVARFHAAIRWFRTIRQLLTELYCSDDEQAKTSRLSLLSSDLIALIVSYAMPRQERLVPCLAKWLEEPPPPVSPPSAAFRVFVRTRPLLTYEKKTDEYVVLSAGTTTHPQQQQQQQQPEAKPEAKPEAEPEAEPEAKPADSAGGGGGGGGGGGAAAAATAAVAASTAATAATAASPAGSGLRGLVCHDGKLDRSGRRLSMKHIEYQVDRVFALSESNDTVCDESVAPLLRHTLAGGHSTLICYGQTGTGKTYTLMGALQYIIHRITSRASAPMMADDGDDEDRQESKGKDEAPPPPGGARGVAGQDQDTHVVLQFIEIHANKAMDLLRDRKKVRMLSDAEERVHARGAKRVVVPLQGAGAAAALRAALEQALARRSIQVTERNPVSSRSHAICELSFFRSEAEAEAAASGKAAGAGGAAAGGAGGAAAAPGVTAAGAPASGESSVGTSSTPTTASGGGGGGGGGGGSITLVDLAGSERNYETVKMTAAMHRESALINKALMALKECFRAHHHLRHGRARVKHTIDRPMERVTMSAAAAVRSGGGGTGGTGTASRGRGQARRGARDIDPHLSFTTYNFTEGRSKEVVSMAVRAPYRASMLTRVLRSCFEDQAHRTAVIATVSPTPTDMQHTLNTLDHVCLMSTASNDEALEGIRRSIVVDVPLLAALARCGVVVEGGPSWQAPVHEWSAEEVLAWLATADGGRFSHIVLPRGTTGKDLLQLGAKRLSSLFALEGAREARAEGEGASWNITLDDDGDAGAGAGAGAGVSAGAGAGVSAAGGGSGTPATGEEADEAAQEGAQEGTEEGAQAGAQGAAAAEAAAAAVTTGTSDGGAGSPAAIARWRRERREAIGRDLYNALRREQTARLANQLGLIA